MKKILPIILILFSTAAFSQGAIGKLPIDNGTEFVFLKKPSKIGGKCSGWNIISIQKPNQPSTGITSLMCWIEKDRKLFVASREEISPTVSSVNDLDRP